MKTSPKNRALLLMTASATLFGFMAFFAKLASARLSGPQVAMVRFGIGLLSAVSSGAAVTAMRRARRGENSWSVYTSFCLLGLITCAPLGIPSWRMPVSSEYMPLALTSIFAIGAQLLLTFSLRWVDAMTVGVISQIAVPLSMILGATLLNDMITPMMFVGSFLTI